MKMIRRIGSGTTAIAAMSVLVTLAGAGVKF